MAYSVRDSVSKKIKDRVNDPGREPASANVMKKSFPNFYGKYGIDPSALSPDDYYRSISTFPFLTKDDNFTRDEFTQELAKDMYGDLNFNNVRPRILKNAGFEDNELPVKIKDIDVPNAPSKAGAYYSPRNKEIVLKPGNNEAHTAAQLMHEAEHAKDHLKSGFRLKPENFNILGTFEDADSTNEYLKNSRYPNDLINQMSEGHHKDFKTFAYDYPQHQITKEHINQNSPVNPDILEEYPDLKDLQNAQSDFNSKIKAPYIDQNSTPKGVGNSMRFGADENLEEDDKTPYDSISSRPPISNPRGRNPATESETNSTPNFDLSLPDSSHAGSLPGGGGSFLDFFHGEDPKTQVSQNVKSAIRNRMAPRNPAGLNPANRSAVNNIKNQVAIEDVQDDVANEESNPPPVDQMGGSVDPSMLQQDQVPQEPPIDTQERAPAGMEDPYLFGNLHMAGTQLSRGSLKPQNENSLALELNKQVKHTLDQGQSLNTNRDKVMAAIAAQKGKQTFQGEQNDLSRASKEKIAGIRAANRPNTQDHFDQNMNFKQKKYIQSRFESLNAALSDEIAKGNTPFAIAAKNKQAIDNVRQLISGKADPNDLNPQEVFETAKSLDRVLSQGQPTDASTGHLTPANAGTWMAKAMQNFSNATKGAQAGEYIKNISKTLDREYIQANSTLQSARNKRLSTAQDLKTIDPQQWDEIMTRHDIGEDGSLNTEVVNGVTYKKVDGGWKAIE